MRNLSRVAHLGSESGKRLGSSSTQPYISRGAVAVDLGVLISLEDPCKIQGKAPGKVTDLPAHSSIGLVKYPQPLQREDLLQSGARGQPRQNMAARGDNRQCPLPRLVYE